LLDQLLLLGLLSVPLKWPVTGAGGSPLCFRALLHYCSSVFLYSYQNHRGKEENLFFSHFKDKYLISHLFRYLVAKGRVDEARELLIKHHAAGDRDSILVAHELFQIQEALQTDANSEGNKMRNVFNSQANRRRFLISAIVGFAAQWSGNSVVSYYLTLVLDAIGITDATSQSLINGGLQIFNLFATIGCGAMLVDKLGRRFLFLWSAMGMAIAYVVRNFISFCSAIQRRGSGALRSWSISTTVLKRV
jgi:hypothetical protein